MILIDPKRVVAPIAGKSAIGIEVPNRDSIAARVTASSEVAARAVAEIPRVRGRELAVAAC